MLAVANRRNAGCGRITLFWSSRVSLPSTSSTRWITNMTSGAAGVIFVEHQSRRVLQRPGQQALAELGHLLAVAQHDRVPADQVDTADMASRLMRMQGPVEPRRDLLDMGRLAGAVIALDHDPAVVGEAREDRQRGVGIEHIGVVESGTRSSASEKAGTSMSLSMPKTSRTFTMRSGASITVAARLSGFTLGITASLSRRRA